MTSETPERPKKPTNESGMSKIGGNADDQLIHNEDEFFRLRELALQPDPPATLRCDVCNFELEKNMNTIDSVHCDQPMREYQKNRAVDADIVRRILQKGKQNAS